MCARVCVSGALGGPHHGRVPAASRSLVAVGAPFHGPSLRQAPRPLHAQLRGGQASLHTALCCLVGLVVVLVVVIVDGGRRHGTRSELPTGLQLGDVAVGHLQTYWQHSRRTGHGEATESLPLAWSDGSEPRHARNTRTRPMMLHSVHTTVFFGPAGAAYQEPPRGRQLVHRNARRPDAYAPRGKRTSALPRPTRLMRRMCTFCFRFSVFRMCLVTLPILRLHFTSFPFRPHRHHHHHHRYHYHH